jgi:hypothetical protein
MRRHAVGKKAFAAALCAAAFTGLSAGSALAGEITGTGESLKIEDSKWGTGLHARSECAFSGLNDDNLPTDAIAQSFGQIIKVAGPLGGVPGEACNPTSGG